MSLEDQVLAIDAKIDALTTEVAALKNGSVDLTPVLAALAEIKSQFEATPVPAATGTTAEPTA